MKKALVICLLSLCSVRAGVAAPIFLFRDVESHTVDRGSDPAELAELDGVVYFAATDDRHGRELWRSDGTAAGTWLVADLCPGRCDSLPEELTAAGDLLFFTATDGVTGLELWRSDGTAAGTRQVVDLCTGACSSALLDLTAVGDRVFFGGPGAASATEPWVSDGTAAGTRRLTTLLPSGDGAFPADWLEFDGRAFFSATSEGAGRELWVSDGTSEGTQLLADLCAGDCSSYAHPLWVFHDKLFFTASTPEDGNELWTTDGTASGTALFKRLVPGPDGVAIDVVLERGGLLYLGGGPFGTGVCGDCPRSVWQTDGTPQGTTVASDLMPYALPRTGPYSLVSAGSRLYWLQQAENPNDYELWVRDGGGRRRLLGGKGFLSPILGLTDGHLILASHAAPGGLWVSDGTVAGTRQIAGVTLGPGLSVAGAAGVALGGKAFFSAGQGVGKAEPWLSDGTVAGTAQVRDLRPERSSSQPRDLAAAGGRLLFVAGASGESDLWASDGTAAGTAVVVEDFTLAAYARLGNRTLVSDFSGSGKLWTSDGTAAGTAEIAGVEAAGHELLRVGNTVYFSAGLVGEQLWRSDGTAAGTRQVKDLNPGFFLSGPGGEPSFLPLSLPSSLTAAGSTIYMVAVRTPGTWELWVSDGSEAGTRLLRSFHGEPVGGFGSSMPSELTPLGGQLLFSAFSSAAGRELWVSDGTAAGTRLLKDLASGAFSGEPAHLTVFGGAVFFTSRREDGGEELWRSDGTPNGTVRVTRFSANGETSLANGMVAAGNRLFLSVWHAATGAELWVSDGTAAGTRRVVDLLPGPLGSAPSEFLPLADGRLLFVASDATHGRELWVSDGSATGTRLVGDLMPGAAASSPEHPTLLGNLVVFAAEDASHGRELFAVKLADLPVPPPAVPCAPNRLCLHDGRFEVGVAWRDFQGNTGPGRVVPGIASTDSGLFWFFQPANYEFLVKVLDGCGVNGHYWVLAAATTNVEYTLTITDTTTGGEAIYTNALGRSSPAIIDVEAFDDCP